MGRRRLTTVESTPPLTAASTRRSVRHFYSPTCNSFVTASHRNTSSPTEFLHNTSAVTGLFSPSPLTPTRVCVCACVCVCVCVCAVCSAPHKTFPPSSVSRLIKMTTRVLIAAPISLDVRAMMIGGGAGLSRVSPNDPCLSRVKRCLFGPRSPQEALQQTQLVASELQRHQDADSKRWNFDFVREEPLPNGRFTWTPCDASPSNRPSSRPSSRPSNPPSNALRQSQITEFLKPRKLTSNGIVLKSSKRLRVHCEAKPRRT